MKNFISSKREYLTDKFVNRFNDVNRLYNLQPYGVDFKSEPHNSYGGVFEGGFITIFIPAKWYLELYYGNEILLDEQRIVEVYVHEMRHLFQWVNQIQLDSTEKEWSLRTHEQDAHLAVEAFKAGQFEQLTKEQINLDNKDRIIDDFSNRLTWNVPS